MVGLEPPSDAWLTTVMSIANLTPSAVICCDVPSIDISRCQVRRTSNANVGYWANTAGPVNVIAVSNSVTTVEEPSNLASNLILVVFHS